MFKQHILFIQSFLAAHYMKSDKKYYRLLCVRPFPTLCSEIWRRLRFLPEPVEAKGWDSIYQTCDIMGMMCLLLVARKRMGEEYLQN
jgi:hypothetical protein